MLKRHGENKIYEFKGTDYTVYHTNFLITKEEHLRVLTGIFNSYKLYAVHISTQLVSVFELCVSLEIKRRIFSLIQKSRELTQRQEVPHLSKRCGRAPCCHYSKKDNTTPTFMSSCWSPYTQKIIVLYFSSNNK